MDSNDEIAPLIERIAELEKQLRQAPGNERFRLVVESSPNGIIVADTSGAIVMVNRKSEEMFGYLRDEFMELSIDSLVPARYRKNHGSLRNKFHQDSCPRSMGAGRDLQALRKDGSEFAVEIALTPLPREDGMWILSSIIDISERKMADAQLSFQAEILRNVHDAVFYVGRDGIVRDWNEGASRIFGVPIEDAVGHPVDALCDRNGARLIPPHILDEVEHRGVAEEVIRYQPHSGDAICVRAKFTLMSDGGSEGLVVCASDITRESRLEAEIVHVSENEQRRIGEDIHDDLCSQLSGIGCLTKVLEKQVEARSPDQAELASKISEMISNAGMKAREIAKGLVPTALETQGLAGAIQVLGSRSQEMFGVPCRVIIENEEVIDRLEREKSVQLYRITQEAVNNAVKHSDADSITVIVRGLSNRLELIIKDDGKGMLTDVVSSGLGLMTMQHRAEIIRADLDVIASPGEGTSIQCILPIYES